MSEPYVGEIRMFGGNFAPVGWELCKGQLISIAENDVLFNLIGTTYGGDGQNTFAVPNLTSRAPVHQGSGYAIGALGGAESVQLTPQQMPQHSHQAMGSSAAGTTGSAQNAVWASSSDLQYSTVPPTGQMSAAELSAVGGSQPHENMPPFLAVNFIISMYGIYPLQN